MDAIKDFLEGIWNTIQYVWDILVSIVENLILGFKYIAMVVAQLTQAINQLPTVLKVYGTITITIIIILFITNRNGGKSNA